MEQLTLRFTDNLAPKPYSAKAKSHIKIYPKEIALKRPYIQPNPPHLCAWLVFDCDHSNQLIFEDVGLPAPNWIAATPASGRFHAAYAIESVYTTINARMKPLSYLAAIQRAYTELLDADAGYTGLITKNPLHKDWNVWFIHDYVYSLGELADYVDLSEPRKVQRSFGFGRNVDLFDRIRKWSYKTVCKFDTFSDFAASVLKRTEMFNNEFDAPLPFNEVKSVSKSVTKYVWKRRIYYASRYERKLGLNENLSLKTKQSLGATYTAEVKSAATEAKIKVAIAELKKDGKKVSKSAVARSTGLSRPTIHKHAHLFEKV